MLGGVPLRVFACAEATLASPRVVFRRAPEPEGWPDRVWRDGTLDPRPDEDRPQIVPPGQAGSPDEPPPPPALPQEGPPPPPRYRLRFAGGLDLEIRAAAAGPPRRLLGDRRDALAGAGRAAIRLRLTLSDDDAATFYRCLPPRIALVVRGRPA